MDVRLNLMQRPNRTQYFEVWVRSRIRPDIRRGSIVERGPDERRKIGILAGAIAEELCETYKDDLEPSAAERAAREVYDELKTSTPMLGNEEPLP